MDVYAHQREWLKYRITKETSAYMVVDIAGLIATYCMPADTPKTIESAQAVKGCAIRLEPMTEQRYAQKYGFYPGVAPQPEPPEPPQLDMWGEPWAEPHEPHGTVGTMITKHAQIRGTHRQSDTWVAIFGVNNQDITMCDDG